MLSVWARRGQITLGLLYLALGALRALPGQTDGLVEPLLLVGGGLLVLIGVSDALRSAVTACVVIWVGGVLGFAASIGTIVIPLLALFVLNATLEDTAQRRQAQPS